MWFGRNHCRQTKSTDLRMVTSSRKDKMSSRTSGMARGDKGRLGWCFDVLENGLLSKFVVVLGEQGTGRELSNRGANIFASQSTRTLIDQLFISLSSCPFPFPVAPPPHLFALFTSLPFPCFATKKSRPHYHQQQPTTDKQASKPEWSVYGTCPQRQTHSRPQPTNASGQNTPTPITSPSSPPLDKCPLKVLFQGQPFSLLLH